MFTWMDADSVCSFSASSVSLACMLISVMQKRKENTAFYVGKLMMLKLPHGKKGLRAHLMQLPLQACYIGSTVGWLPVVNSMTLMD